MSLSPPKPSIRTDLRTSSPSDRDRALGLKPFWAFAGADTTALPSNHPQGEENHATYFQTSRHIDCGSEIKSEDHRDRGRRRGPRSCGSHEGLFANGWSLARILRCRA